MMSTDTPDALPPLPEPAGFSAGSHDLALFTPDPRAAKNYAKGSGKALCEWFSADQMRDYARAALAQRQQAEPLTESDTCELRAAAKAVIDRWHTPAWKDVPHTAEFIYRLERALSISKKEGSA